MYTVPGTTIAYHSLKTVRTMKGLDGKIYFYTMNNFVALFFLSFVSHPLVSESIFFGA